MRRYEFVRFIPIILIVITVAFLIYAAVSIGRSLIFGNESSKSPENNQSQTQLVSLNSSASVRMNVRGPIVATENFKGYSITIAPQSRQLTVYSGYNLNTLQQVSLGNIPSGYEQFVYALKNYKLAENSELTGDKNDTRGVCPTGILYEFAILDNNKSVKTLWTTTCANYRGSLKSNRTDIYNLFVNQIPNGSSIISTYNIN